MSEEKTYPSYPSLYALGHRAISEIFLDDVTVEEKVDGSQFSAGVFNGELQCRSKRCVLADPVPDLFKGAVETFTRLHAEGRLAPDVVYRGESIQSPRHNTLHYGRVPVGNVIIFDIMRGGLQCYVSYEEKLAECERLGLECVPLFYSGRIDNLEHVKSFLDRDSVLGNVKIEGFVIKNYSRFGVDKKPLFGKFVSEHFKEVHDKGWKELNPRNGDIIEKLIDRYRSEARWAKALLHLSEQNLIDGSPKDIGPLIVEVKEDIQRECKQEIGDMLFNWAWKQINQKLVGGLPQWYKERLLQQSVLHLQDVVPTSEIAS